MKLVAVALLFPGMMCNSMLAIAQGPVPFSAYMRAAGAQPSVSPAPDAKDQFTPVSNHPAHPTHMTSGGKAMIGGGVAMLAIGGAVIAGSALVVSGGFANSSKGAALLATGGGLAAGGITLIVLGKHRRIPD
jgi:hypothetical protein